MMCGSLVSRMSPGSMFVLALVRELRLDRVRQPADEHRQAEADRDGVAIGVEQARP